MNTLQQEARIDALMRKFETLEGQLQQVMAEMKDEIQTIGNETNMTLHCQRTVQETMMAMVAFSNQV